MGGYLFRRLCQIVPMLLLIGTAIEWTGLIVDHGLTIRTNLFGTTFYSLVGFHAAHVAAGLLMLTLILVMTITGHVRARHDAGR